MKSKRPNRKLTDRPDLDQLKRQAKELLAGFASGDPDAAAEIEAHYRGAERASFALHDAQLVIARSYGFESWPKLKAYVDGATVQRLADFVRSNDLAQAESMLRRRPELADMQMSYGDEHRPLHFAVMRRLPAMTRLLMRHGADAHCGIHPHRDATTAITLARERGFDEIVAAIEEEEQRRREAMTAPGACVTNRQDELTEAILEGNEEHALAILQSDPSLIDASDRDGWTPLHAASAVRSPKLVAWLIGHGADPNRRGSDGRTPLDLAAGGRRQLDAAEFSSVAKMLRGAGADLTPRGAAALGEADWLRARHAEGTLVNPVTWEAGGLLTIAVRHNRPEILDLLLGFGFDPDEHIRSGEGPGTAESQGFPLWQCAALGRHEMAETLLRRGADPNVHVDSSGSSVYSAYSHRQWHMVELLRRHGGIVGADTAAIYRQTDLARRMLDDDSRGVLAPGVTSGAPLAEDLLRFGASGGDPEIVRMALARIDLPAGDDRWFHFLVQPLSFWHHIPWLYAGDKDLDRGTYLECFRLILERSGPNVRGGFGRTALHEVASIADHVTEEESAPFAAALLDAGAETGVRDEILKSTPLGWASRWGRLSVVRELLDHGADPVEADAEPWARPKAWAKKMGHEAVLKLLIERGA